MHERINAGEGEKGLTPAIIEHAPRSGSSYMLDQNASHRKADRGVLMFNDVIIRPLARHKGYRLGETHGT